MASPALTVLYSSKLCLGSQSNQEQEPRYPHPRASFHPAAPDPSPILVAVLFWKRLKQNEGNVHVAGTAPLLYLCVPLCSVFAG